MNCKSTFIFKFFFPSCIYTYVLKALKVSAKEILFIDDLGINLKPAREIGILTYKFIDSKTTIRYIKNELNL